MNDILKKIAQIRLERLAAEKRLMSLEAMEQKASAKGAPAGFPWSVCRAWDTHHGRSQESLSFKGNSQG